MRSIPSGKGRRDWDLEGEAFGEEDLVESGEAGSFDEEGVAPQLGHLFGDSGVGGQQAAELVEFRADGDYLQTHSSRKFTKIIAKYKIQNTKHRIQSIQSTKYKIAPPSNSSHSSHSSNPNRPQKKSAI